jgi:hypothetical protein
MLPYEQEHFKKKELSWNNEKISANVRRSIVCSYGIVNPPCKEMTPETVYNTHLDRQKGIMAVNDVET